MKKEMREGALKTREGVLGVNIVITYAVAEVRKDFFTKNTTKAEADALKMLSKMTENVEEPMEMEMR